MAAARHHLHIVGATGSGKSTLLANMVRADAQAGRGAVVLDPRGDLIRDILASLRPVDRRRAIVLDPDSPAPPPRLNILAPVPGLDDTVVVDNLVGTLQRIWAAWWGPRTDTILRSVCLALLEEHRRTGRPVSFTDIPTVLSDPARRRRLLRQVTNPDLVGFFDDYQSLSPAARLAETGPVMNKIRAITQRRYLREVISGPATVNIPSILNGGLLLARLPKGSLGSDTSRLLGSMIVASCWHAATARARQPEHTRRDAALVLDEFQNWLNLPYPPDELAAEARGYRLCLVLAHQDLAQLPKAIGEGVSANARNKIFFNLSPEDADHLAKHTTPTVTAHDLANLGKYTAAARLVTDQGDQQAAFTLITRPLGTPNGDSTAGSASGSDDPSQPNPAHHTGRVVPAGDEPDHEPAVFEQPAPDNPQQADQPEPELHGSSEPTARPAQASSGLPDPRLPAALPRPRPGSNNSGPARGWALHPSEHGDRETDPYFG